MKCTKKLEKSCYEILDFNLLTDHTLTHFVSFAVILLS